MSAVLKSDVSNVVDVQVLSFSEATVELGVVYKGWPAHLANELQMAHFRIRYFNSTLKAVEGNKLVIRIESNHSGG